MPGVWPAVLQNSTKYVPTTATQANAASSLPSVSSRTSPTSEPTSARTAPPAKTIICAIATSIASATARVATPA